MKKMLTITIMVITIVVTTGQSVWPLAYLDKPNAVVLLIMPRTKGCNPPPPACFGEMKSLNKSFLYYNNKGELKRKLKWVWVYRK